METKWLWNFTRISTESRKRAPSHGRFSFTTLGILQSSYFCTTFFFSDNVRNICTGWICRIFLWGNWQTLPSLQKLIRFDAAAAVAIWRFFPSFLLQRKKPLKSRMLSRISVSGFWCCCDTDSISRFGLIQEFFENLVDISSFFSWAFNIAIFPVKYHSGF